MSRIFAIVSKNNEVSNKIFEGLKKLDFYPYDSVGIATLNRNSIRIKKNKGKIEEIFSEEDLKNLSGKIGVGHLRWATHGAPAEFNSHPLTDCYNNIAVVQNGVIGNFLQLKDELIQSNHKFVSKTDTEVIAHHLEKISEYNINYFNQITEVLKKLEGCFSLVIISKNLKNYLIAFSKGLPLYIGLGKEENYVSSEPAGFIKQTNKFIKLEEDEIALVGGDSYKIFSINGLLELNKEAVESTWNEDEAKKLGYEHMVLREIMEQPYTFKTAMHAQKPYLELISEYIDKANRNFIVASYSSYNAAIAASYLFSKLANITVYPSHASEFIEQFGSSIDISTTILFSSPSGRDKEILSVVEFARMRACTILAMSNEAYCPLTGMSRTYIVQNAGAPLTKYSIKDFTSQLIIYLNLALTLAKKRGKISQDEIDVIYDEIKELPSLASVVLKKTFNQMREIAKIITNKNFIFVLSRGINYATALEGKTKLNEIAKINAIAYPAGESKHGPISLIEKDVPVIFIAPPDETRKLILGNVQEMAARDALVISFGVEGDRELSSMSKIFIEMPRMHNFITPIIYTLPLQLLSYFLAKEKNINVY